MKSARQLLGLDSRAESTACAVQADRVAQAIRLYLTITESPGSGGLQVVIRGIVGEQAVELTQGGAIATDPGTYVYEMGNPVAVDVFGKIMESSPRAVPYHWCALVKHQDGAPYTYQLAAEIVA